MLNIRRLKYCLPISVLFLIFFALGSIMDLGDASGIFSSPSALIGFAIRSFFAAALFFMCVYALFTLAERSSFARGTEPVRTDIPIFKYIYEHPFTFSFILMTLLYIPYIILSYPAIFMGDTPIIIRQIMKAAEPTSSHPLVFVYLLTAFIRLGLLIFRSWNITLFVFSMFQLLSALAVIAYSIKVLVNELHIHWVWVLALCLFFSLHPIIQNYMFLLSKDTLYAVSILLLGTVLFCVMRHGWNKRDTVLFLIAAIGTAFFRIEGFYLVLILLVILLFRRKQWRRKTAVFLLVVVMISFGINNVLVPCLGIIPGTKREILSIPLQQTGRYVAYSKDEITPEEEEILLNAFSFYSLDEMAWSYIPSLSDPMKEHFLWDITRDEAKAYYKLWARMGLKKPSTYIAAYIDNYYMFTYPSTVLSDYTYSSSEECMEKTIRLIGHNADMHHPEALSSLRQSCHDIHMRSFSVFPLVLLNSSCTCYWALLIFITWLLYRKNYSALIILTAPIVIMVFCFFSPVNGSYSRYQYPILFYLPWAIPAAGGMYTGR